MDGRGERTCESVCPFSLPRSLNLASLLSSPHPTPSKARPRVLSRTCLARLMTATTLHSPRKKHSARKSLSPGLAAALLIIAAAAAGGYRRASSSAPLPRPLGPFPPGCVWAASPQGGTRFVRRAGGPSEGGWRAGTKDRPAACDLAPRRPLSPPSPLTTTASCDAAACTYSNLWHLDGSWYALVNGAKHAASPGDEGWALSKHAAVRPLRVSDPAAWARAVAPGARFIPAASALLDYRFFLHPTAIGHWAEHALGLCGAVRKRKGEGKEGEIARLLLLHAPRAAVGEWVRTALAAALRCEDGEEEAVPTLPPLHFQAEAAGAASLQNDPAAPPPLRTPPGAPLEGVPRHAWLLFEEVVVPQDPPQGTPTAAFVGTETARAFRAAFWRAAGVEVPTDPGPSAAGAASRPILFLAKAANRRVLGGEGLKKALLDATNATSLRVAAFTDATPVADQLRTLASVPFLVGPHTSALAATALLPPGTALLELLPFAWAWGGLDATFAAMATALGDVHFAAWRAEGGDAAAWADGRDAARFGGWGAGECTTEGCVEAVTRSDFGVVDAKGVGEAAAGLAARAGLWGG